MNKYLYVFGGVICFILMSCKSDMSRRVERALKYAGDNRIVLDSVLEYYKDNPLKREAAYFLIANMPYYFSFSSPAIDSIKYLEKKFLRKRYYTKEELAKWESIDWGDLKKIYDIQVINADLLIENIDLAFKAWESRSWSKYYSFADFCEYILPYRIGTEPLEKWRKVYYERYNHVLDSLYQGTDVLKAAQEMIVYLRKEGFVNNRDGTYPNLGAMFLLENRVGFCRDACDVASYVMRAIGIPVGIDNYITSPSYRLRHFWNALIDTTGMSIPFNYPDKIKVTRVEHDNRKRGKVYRTCFGIQSEKIKGIYKDKNVPVLFRNIFLRDVTKEYFPKNKVEFNVTDKNIDYAYLSIYDGQKYIPIDISVVKSGKAQFNNMEDSLVYYPSLIKEGVMEPAGYPFLLNNQIQEYFVPDLENRIEVKLWRKYPLLENRGRRIVGSKIEGANRKDFKDAKLLYDIKEIPEINYNSVMIHNVGYYRYIRYIAPDNWPLVLAEMMLYGGKERWEPIDIYIENSSDSIYEKNLWNIFDDDWVTYYASRKRKAHAVFDLGEKKLINRIVYIPRNDDNYIHPGDTYELYYHDGKDGLKYIDRKLADTTFVSFRNVPSNAILWLKNITRGREERAFYYRDGKQIFP